MKNIKSHNIKILLIGLLLLLSVSVASSWQDPTTSPSSTSLGAPIHTGIGSQTKEGSLSIGSLLIANKSAYFDQDIAFTGTVYGGIPGGVQPLALGGTDQNGTNRIVNLKVPNGAVNTVGSIKVKSVAGGKGEVNGLSKLCVDMATGNVVLCDAPTAGVIIRNKTGYPAFDVSNVGISYNPSTYPQDYGSSADFYNLKLPFTFKAKPYASCLTGKTCNIKVLFEVTDNDLKGNTITVHTETITANSTTKVSGTEFSYSVPGGHLVLLSVTATNN